MVTITRPSTIDGIKRLAKAVKRAHGIPHQSALELAAKQSGFQNFVHAKHSLAGASRPAAGAPQGHLVYLSAYWREKEGMPRPAGRETLEIELSRPLTALIARHQLRRARNLSGFKLEAADHLEKVTNADSQESARSSLALAARTLRFIEATVLAPASNQAHFSAMRIAHELPGKDHYSWWLDPVSKDWLVLDEPYGGRDRLFHDRESWAKDNSLVIARAGWDGLYYPGQCTPFILSRSQELIDRVLSQVATLDGDAPAHERLISESYFSVFISPARVASGSVRKPRPGPSYGQHRGALAYGGAPGVASDWRPANPLPIEAHMTVGPMLHALCVTRSSLVPSRAHDKINIVRSTLEDWAFMEHRDAITREVEEKLYYGPTIAGYSTAQDALLAIDQVRRELLAGYAECKPRRELMALLDAARELVAAKAAKG